MRREFIEHDPYCWLVDSGCYLLLHCHTYFDSLELVGTSLFLLASQRVFEPAVLSCVWIVVVDLFGARTALTKHYIIIKER